MPGIDNDDATPVDPPTAALGRLVDHFAGVLGSLRQTLPRLPFADRDTRRYLVDALAEQFIELGYAAIDAAAALKGMYG